MAPERTQPEALLKREEVTARTAHTTLRSWARQLCPDPTRQPFWGGVALGPCPAKVRPNWPSGPRRSGRLTAQLCQPGLWRLLGKA